MALNIKLKDTLGIARNRLSPDSATVRPDGAVSDNLYKSSPSFAPTPAPTFIDVPKTTTVATKDNPVIDKTKPTPPTPVPTTYDTSSIGGMDKEGLQDYIDQTYIRTRRGEQMTADQEAQLFKAQRRLQELAVAQATVNPREQQLQDAEQKKQDEQARLRLQSQQLLDMRRQELEAQYGLKAGEKDKQGQKTMEATQGVLSFSGFGRSTYAAEKQAEIQDIVNQSKNSLTAEKEAEIAKYQAELAGADATELSKHDEYINQLRIKNAEYMVSMAKSINEYNLKTDASYQEKIDNIFKLAETNNPGDLTPEEKARAGAYAGLLFDNDGNLNTALIKDIPPRLVNEAIMQGAQIKASKPEKRDRIELSDGLYELNDQGVWEKVAGGYSSDWKSDGLGGFWRTNPVTGQPEEWNGTQGPPNQGPSGQTDQSAGAPSTVNSFIEKYEGFRDKAYRDVNGWAVGYGQHAINGVPVKEGQTIDRVTADTDLNSRVQNAKYKSLIKVPLSGSQEAALYSLEHNVGGGVWDFPNGKKIIDAINSGNLQQASNILATSGIGTTNAGTGEVMNGLVNRRREEAQLLMIPKDFELRDSNKGETQGQYSDSQKNLMNALKDKTLGKSELTDLRKAGLTSQDVYNYTASERGLELSDDQRVMYNTQLSNFRTNPVVKAFEEGIQNYDNIAASLDDVSGVGDMAGVYQFMKSLDPQSVVRETEFNIAAGSAGVVNQLGNTFARLSEGKVLTEDQATAFKKLAKVYIQNRAKSYDRLYGDMERALTNSKIDKSYYPTKASAALDQVQSSLDKTVTRTGKTEDGRSVVQYSDGSIEYK